MPMSAGRGSDRARRVACTVATTVACLVGAVTLVTGEAAEETAGRLTVATEPAGALVYIDGRVQGQAPVEIVDLPAGDHRVTVVKRGYLENSRVVNLLAATDRTVRVRMTETMGGDATASMQPGVGSRRPVSSGGARNWLKWALPAAGGGAAALFLLMNRNQPPVARLTASPRQDGMRGVTRVGFDAGGSSDPDNDRLTYSWDFGDGNRGSGVTTTHVYDRAGRFDVVLTVSDGKEQATARGFVTINRDLNASTWLRNNTVTWRGLRLNVRHVMDLRQNGTRISGRVTLTFSGGGISTVTLNTSLSGDIRSAENFVCPCNVNISGRSGVTYSIVGVLNRGTTTITGENVYGGGNFDFVGRNVTFRIQ